jgi:hypothetical protein
MSDKETDDESVYASGEEVSGTTSVYTPVAYDNLDTAPETTDQPDSGTGGRHRLLDLPKVPRLKHVIGPSAIMLGASLGSGETLFWPQLVAQYGWSVYWIFVAGVLFQFVVNTEIQRWTLATGESIFRAMERVHPAIPMAFMLGGFASLGWPGWAASAAKVGAGGLSLGTLQVFDLMIPGWRALGIALMIGIWLTYQVAPLMYNVVEPFQVLLVVLSMLSALGLFALVGDPAALGGLSTSLGSLADQPPVGAVALLLGAIAYAGAGGYLNLSQSLWVREKGYGMGRYQGRIKNPFAGDDPEEVHEDGFSFVPESPNVERWRAWWRVTQLEHLLTFVVGLVIVTTVMVSIAMSLAPGTELSAVDMWLVGIVPSVGWVAGALIYATLFLSLFTTEYAIIESFVRNSSDVIYELYGRDAGWALPKVFWTLLTVFCGWGVLILSLPFEVENPFNLLVIGAAASGLIMWPYIVVTQLINACRLPEHTMPGWSRTVAMWFAAGFFGYFSVLLIGTVLANELNVTTMHVSTVVVGSAPGGYVLWLAYAVVQAYTVTRTTQAQLAKYGTVAETDTSRGPFP